MSDDNIVNIPVVLAGRTYPALVTKQEMEAVKFINEKLNEEFLNLQKLYPRIS